MISETWRNELRDFIQHSRASERDLGDDVVKFFELAFSRTRCPDRAWFGTHSQTASLVVGGIFLAAIVRSGNDKGIWLLVDHDRTTVENFEFRPVKSTKNSDAQLLWAHSDSLDSISDVIAELALWDSFSDATDKVLTSSFASGDRDSVQESRNKKRLSDIWPVHQNPDASRPGTSEKILADDLQAIFSQAIEVTTRETLVNARIGQGLFRHQVLGNWKNACAVSGAQMSEVIRASHIKPWRVSDSNERLDPFNGLPLTATLDALFDAGLISFTDDGSVLLSRQIPESERSLLNLTDVALSGPPPRESMKYLEYHRTVVFQK
jgi:hypothetical protein